MYKMIADSYVIKRDKNVGIIHYSISYAAKVIIFHSQPMFFCA